MAVFEVPNASINLKIAADGEGNVTLRGVFSYYPQSIGSAMADRFSQTGVVEATVSLATFDALTGAQMRTQLKARIDDQLEEGGKHSVVYV